MHIIKPGGKRYFQLRILSHLWDRGTKRGRHRGALNSPLHNYLPSTSHNICIAITFSERLVHFQKWHGDDTPKMEASSSLFAWDIKGANG